MQLITANWREWYKVQHQSKCYQSGSAFEDYVSSVLSRFHDDFINPDPAGQLGDGGCDGLASSGTIFYAVYGQRPGRNAERELTKKINSDFARGLSSQWEYFHTWKFVTNAPVGPHAAKAITELQQEHGPYSNRPLTIRLVKSEDLWAQVVSTLGKNVLNEIFPGAPGAENIGLSDLIPLLDELNTADSVIDSGAGILPVPVTKMDFNALPHANRLELNAGRALAPRIDYWYEGHSDPDLSDTHGKRFRALYKQALEVTEIPNEILERMYVAVAGANFRMDGKRANAAYAVVSYFFDSCYIFEDPSAGDDAGSEVLDAPAH